MFPEQINLPSTKARQKAEERQCGSFIVGVECVEFKSLPEVHRGSKRQGEADMVPTSKRRYNSESEISSDRE